MNTLPSGSSFDEVKTLRQLLNQFPIGTIAQFLYEPIGFQALQSTRCCRVIRVEAVLELLRLELIGQFAETVIIAGGAATLHKLLVLVGEIVESHLTEEELLTASR